MRFTSIHILSVSLYGGLMAVVLNYTSIATFSIPSLQFGVGVLSFITGFLIAGSALWLYRSLGPFPCLKSSNLSSGSGNLTQPSVDPKEKKIHKELTNKNDI